MNSDSNSSRSAIAPHELARCCEILEFLSQAPDHCLQPDSDFATVFHRAATLTKLVKRQLKRDSAQRDRELVELAGIRKSRQQRRQGSQSKARLRETADSTDIDNTTTASQESSTQESQIHQRVYATRRCYVCKKQYSELHHFYDCLCTACGNVNYTKRMQSANLTGRTVLVTGGRVKIGHQISIKFLRAGATVLVTSRFPADTARRFAEAEDFQQWRERLTIFGVDFRCIPALESFLSDVAERHNSLDILINNAAQTIRRPPAFYRHVREKEEALFSELEYSAQALIADTPRGLKEARLNGSNDIISGFSAKPKAIPFSAALTQHRLNDVDDDTDSFPVGQLDEHGQQVDQRGQNSWIAKVSDVSLVELVEVHAVNSFAPFLILQRLEPLIKNAPVQPRFVVNVSAMEGRFDHFKTGRHPHTDMAKAALNMLTRSTAEQYAEHQIFMNSVDTGWVTNEFPYAKVAQMESNGFQPPLDEIDGASRVCDPIFSGIRNGNPVFGQFLKDYQTISW